MSREVRIGYWAQKEYPDPGLTMPIPNTAKPDQETVVALLKEAMRTGYHVHYRGWSNCRVCGKNNGSRELEIIHGDTKYCIPEGYVHYLEDHKVGYDDLLLEALRDSGALPARRVLGT